MGTYTILWEGWDEKKEETTRSQIAEALEAQTKSLEQIEFLIGIWIQLFAYLLISTSSSGGVGGEKGKCWRGDRWMKLNDILNIPSTEIGWTLDDDDDEISFILHLSFCNPWMAFDSLAAVERADVITEWVIEGECGTSHICWWLDELGSMQAVWKASK